jgi:hypothetical protein
MARRSKTLRAPMGAMKRAIAGLAVSGLLFIGCSDTGMVDELTIGNETSYPARVEVADGDRSGWLRLALVRQGTSETIHSVVDQGDTWVFRFNYAHRHSESVEVERAALEEGGWQVEVPESFEQALAELGVEPPL